jgi:GNAT superfamily N-acetyltransferase
MDDTLKVSLIQATQFDSERLAEISKNAFDTDVDYGSTDIGGPPGYDDPEWQNRAMKIMDYYCILLEDSIVGGVVVGDGGGVHKILERIFVEPENFRKGVGSQAMKLTMNEYPEATVWTLGTPEWNIRTKAFYEKLGFTQIGWDNNDANFRGIWYQKTTNSWIPHKIKELRDGMGNVTVEGTVEEKSDARMVRSRRRYGETLSVADAGFKDESGRLVLTLWNEQIKIVQVGDRIRVENGYVGSYRGVKQLSVGKVGRIIHLL